VNWSKYILYIHMYEKYIIYINIYLYIYENSLMKPTKTKVGGERG
jgi:hypothetical protein